VDHIHHAGLAESVHQLEGRRAGKRDGKRNREKELPGLPEGKPPAERRAEWQASANVLTACPAGEGFLLAEAGYVQGRGGATANLLVLSVQALDKEIEGHHPADEAPIHACEYLVLESGPGLGEQQRGD